jgi:hypothetical protein
MPTSGLCRSGSHRCWSQRCGAWTCRHNPRCSEEDGSWPDYQWGPGRWLASGSPLRCSFARAVGVAQVDPGVQSRLWNDHALPFAHGPGSLLLQRRGGTAARCLDYADQIDPHDPADQHRPDRGRHNPNVGIMMRLQQPHSPSSGALFAPTTRSRQDHHERRGPVALGRPIGAIRRHWAVSGGLLDHACRSADELGPTRGGHGRSSPAPAT